MSNQLTFPFEDASETPAPAKFNVVTIYETSADGMRAKEFSDRVAAEVAEGHDLAINLNVWSFQVLRMPEGRAAQGSLPFFRTDLGAAGIRAGETFYPKNL